MAQLYTNNAESTLASGIDNDDTTLTVQSGHGAKFPSPTNGDYFLLTLTQAASESSWEIVQVTARSSDTLTIVRAQEGTSAASWLSGDKAELRITAGSLTKYEGANDIALALSDEFTAITAGTGKITIRVLRAMTIAAVRASLTTASTSGVVTVDINKNGSTILSTKLTIDQGEKTSLTADVPYALSSTALAVDDELSFDIDTPGANAVGLKVALLAG